MQTNVDHVQILKNLSWIYTQLSAVKIERNDFKDVMTAFEVQQRLFIRITTKLDTCIQAGLI